MFEILVALQVKDDDLYATYRAHMTPLLGAAGGSFGLDVRVSEVLKSPEMRAFNRLFTIRFPSRGAHDAFFADPAYLAVRAQFFEPSVVHTLQLGRYEVVP
ncbi:MAG: DUF1330 domain-containing protein [Polyangia bacterium]